jgi:hypothetical protein
MRGARTWALLGAVLLACRGGSTRRPALWGGGALLPRLALRLRGGRYLDDVEPLELGLDDRDIERLHFEIGKDETTGPIGPEYVRRAGNRSLFGEDATLDEDGASDGFPFDWTQWAPDARYHLGFRAPHTLVLNRSIYATFDDGELVVIRHADGTQRFAQVLGRKSEGYFRGEVQVGHQYNIRLEPAAPGCLPREKILDGEDMGKMLSGWVPGRDSLDPACRLEGACRLREMGNRALNRSLLEEASRKYVKALAYLDGLEMEGKDSSAIVDEWIKVQLNLALVHLRGQQLHECIESCDAVLQLRPNETKALYRSGQAFKRLGRNREAAQR